MKTNRTTTATYRLQEDEFTTLYNWSERTAVFFKTKSKRTFRLLTGLVDFLYMAAMSIALIYFI